MQRPLPKDPIEARSITRYFPTVVRLLMGLPLLVFGLNGFLNFIPPPSTPLPALALFAPFIVNSIAFHCFLAPSGLPMAGVFLAFELYLAWAFRHAYRTMLAARVTPI